MLSRILFCCLALLLCASLPAQKTKDRVKNRAERRTNSNVDRKVDRAVDDAFNAVGNLFKKKKKTKNTTGAADEPAGNQPRSGTARTDDDGNDNDAAAAMMGSLFGGGNFEPYTNEKSFSVVLHTTETKKNGKQQRQTMHVATLPTQVALRMNDDDEGDARTLFDTQTGKTTMITTNKQGKTEATRMRMPNLGGAAMDDALEEAEQNFTFETTSETRTIDGYHCRKIIARDNKTGNVTEGWVTEEIDLDYVDIFGGIATMFAGGNAKQLREKMPAPPVNGLMLEGTTTEPNGKRVTMRLTDIRLGEGNVDRTLFDTSGITIQDAGF